jgi:cysteine-rich repeat protein
MCYSDSTLSADNFTCVCLPGFTVTSNLCVKEGCASAFHFENGTECLACNASNHMEFNGLFCECALGYRTSAKTCELICGDGRVITEACDDGNNITGDGCSSNCTIEADYTCSGGSLFHASVCAYSSPISITLVEVRRAVDSNTAIITLNLAPSLAPFS